MVIEVTILTVSAKYIGNDLWQGVDGNIYKIVDREV